jgi:coenzyme F420-dependent oxidoreductase
MVEVGIRLPQPHEVQDFSTVAEYAQLAESAGIDQLWFSESYGRNMLVPLVLSMDRTDSIEFGTAIANVYSRSPALLAMTAGALAELSDGRFTLGIGASGPAVIENFHGVDFDRPLRRTREYIEILNAFVDGEQVDYDGDIFDLAGFSLDPSVDYDVPVYVAAMGETNRQLTGEFADGWLPFLIPVDAIPSAMEAVERGADRGERSVDDVTVAPFVITCVSASDPEATRDIARKQFSFYVSAMGDYYYNVVKNHGFETEADAVRSAWHDGEYEKAREAVTDEILADFTLTGSPGDVEKTLGRYYDAGVDQPVANVPARYMDDEMIRDTIQALGDGVAAYR